MACRKPNTFLVSISIGIDNHFEVVCSDAVRRSSNSVRSRNGNQHATSLTGQTNVFEGYVGCINFTGASCWVMLTTKTSPTFHGDYMLNNHSQKREFSLQGNYKNSEYLSSGHISLVLFNTFVKTNGILLLSYHKNRLVSYAKL